MIAPQELLPNRSSLNRHRGALINSESNFAIENIFLVGLIYG